MQDEKDIIIHGKKINGTQFNNELLGFSFNMIENDESFTSFENLLLEIGHIYTFENTNYIFFNKF